jgi:hypothetical protein
MPSGVIRRHLNINITYNASINFNNKQTKIIGPIKLQEARKSDYFVRN